MIQATNGVIAAARVIIGPSVEVTTAIVAGVGVVNGAIATIDGGVVVVVLTANIIVDSIAYGRERGHV